MVAGYCRELQGFQERWVDKYTDQRISGNVIPCLEFPKELGPALQYRVKFLLFLSSDVSIETQRAL